MGTSKFYAVEQPCNKWNPIQGEVDLYTSVLLLASCYTVHTVGDRDKHWPDGPLGSYCLFSCDIIIFLNKELPIEMNPSEVLVSSDVHVKPSNNVTLLERLSLMGFPSLY